MRRSPVLVLASVFALVTSLALLRSSETLRPASVPRLAAGDPADANASVVLVRRFYAAINVTLRTGDPGALDQLVAPDLVEHPTRLGDGSGRAGLDRYLIALHGVFPTMRVALDDIIAQGDEVTTRSSMDGIAGGVFAGMSVPGDLAVWGPVDVFRVADGRIVEHWAGRPDLALLQPLGEVTLTGPGFSAPADSAAQSAPSSLASSPRLAFDRLTYAPNSAEPISTLVGPGLVYLQSGRLAVQASAGTFHLARAAVPPGGAGVPVQDPAPDGSTIGLNPGDAILVPAPAGMTFQNVDNAPAVALEVHLTVPVSADTRSFGLPPMPGVTITPLSAPNGIVLPPGPIGATLGRAALAAGASLPTHTAAGPEFVFVESGNLDLAIARGLAWSRRPGGLAVPVAGDRTMLTAGGGANIEAGTVSTLRNDGPEPATVLLAGFLPIQPVADGPSVATPSDGAG